MNRLIFIAIALTGWILFAVANRDFFLDRISAMPVNTSNNSGNSTLPTIRQNLATQGDRLQNQIKSELYSSISTGMTYAEVSSILGWEGILVYENIADNGVETIETKVYRWNYDDGYSVNLGSDELTDNSKIDAEQSLALEFQNGILIELNDSSSNLYRSQ